MDHRLDRLLESLARRQSPVRFDENAKPVEIRPITDAHVLHFVIDTADGREDSVERDGADINALFLVRLFRDVAQPPLRFELELERRLAGNFRDVALRIQDLHLSGEFQIGRSDGARPLHAKRDGLRFVGRDLQADLPYVEKDGDNVFLDAFDGRELMCDAGDLYMGDGGAGKRREYDTAERVAERVAVARIQAVNFVCAASFRF